MERLVSVSPRRCVCFQVSTEVKFLLEMSHNV